MNLSPPDHRPATRRVARQVTTCRLAGVTAGVAAAGALATSPGSWLGLGQALAASAFAVCLLAGVLIGELIAAGHHDTVRTAALEVRETRAYLPPVLARAVAGTLCVLTVFLVLTTWVADPDDAGRAGRALTLTCGAYSTTGTPWPGVYYAAPIALVTLAGVAVAAAALRRLTRRPRPGTGTAEVAADDRTRRASARAITAAVGVLAAAPLAGTATFASGRLIGLSSGPCPAPWLTATGWGTLALGGAAAIAVCVFVAALLTPDSRA